MPLLHQDSASQSVHPAGIRDNATFSTGTIASVILGSHTDMIFFTRYRAEGSSFYRRRTKTIPEGPATCES
jgi:hypothetical protein